MKILREADDVTDEIIELTLECLDWFQEEPSLNTEIFIDRLCDEYGGDDWDIENYDCPAARKIMRIARASKREG